MFICQGLVRFCARTHTHILLLNHWATSSTYFYLFFFFFKLFFLLLSTEKQKQNLFLSLLVHIYNYTSSSLSLPSFLFYLPTSYFTVTLPSSFSLFYNLTLLLPILFVHIYGGISSNLSLPSLPLYLPHYSSLHRYTSFIIFSFL